MKRIYQQIETTADLYTPSVYALLPLFRDFQKEADPTSANFIPLISPRNVSGTSPVPDVINHKIFAIGILPPPIEVTGRYLDRGANLGGTAAESAAGDVGTTTPPEEPAPFVSGGADCTAQVGQDATSIPKEEAAQLAFLAAQGDYLPDGSLNPFTKAYLTGVGGGTNCCNTVCAIWRKCGLNDPRLDKSATSYAVKDNGQMYSDVSNKRGACMWAKIAQDNGALHMGTETGAFPKPGDAVLARRFKDGKPDPSAQHALTIVTVKGTYTTSAEGGSFRQHETKQINGTYPNQQNWFVKDGCWHFTDLYATRIVLYWAEVSKMPFGQNSTVPPDTNTGNWKEGGSDPAKDAANQTETDAGKETRQESAGERYQKEQKRMIDATREALDRLKNTPPLKLLVNPTSFKVGSEKIIADGNRSRSAHIIEHWGEQQDKIEGSGKLAGFFSADLAGTSGGPGLTRTARQYSTSYQNFLSLFQLYKSNGGMWLQDFFDARMDPEARNLSCLGSLYIYYDNTLYIGSFDTLTASETDTAPYTLEYSFAFSARAVFLLDRELENPQQDYGMAGMFPQAMPTSSGATPTEAPAYTEPAPDPETQALIDANRESLESDAEEARQEAADAAAFKESDALFSPPPAPSGGDNAVTKGKGGKSKSMGR